MGLATMGRLVSLLLATTFLTIKPSLPAMAQQERGPVAPQRQAGTTFNLPAQPLPQTLHDIARATGVSVAFSERELAGITARPVSGRMSPRQAVDAAVAGTGASYRFSGARKVTV